MARRPSSVRPSVCPSVCETFCANRFYQTNGRIATKLAHDGLQVSLHPGCAQDQGQGQRSRDTSTFGISKKNAINLSLTSPFLCPFDFLPHPNPQMAVSLRCE